MQMWYAKNSLEDSEMDMELLTWILGKGWNNPSKDTENAEREGNKPPNNKHNPDN